MNRQIHLTDLAADEQLLDRLGARSDAGTDPVALLLAALARHADTPLRTGPAPRRFTRRRTLTALTALVVGASGAGVAAAVSQPQAWLTREPARVTAFDAARPALTQPGQLTLAPLPAPVVASDGYILVRDAAGQIVLLPPKVVVEVAPAPAPVVVAAEPITQDVVEQPEVEAQAAATNAGESTEPPVLASASGPAKAKPTEQPGKTKPRGPAGPGGSDEELTLASLPADPEPIGQSIAAALRPSTPGTLSGPGVPARPDKPEQAKDPHESGQAEKPEQANDAGKPEHVEDSDHPETPDQPGEPAEPDKPSEPTGSDRPSEPSGPDKPDTPAPEPPVAPQPGTPPVDEPERDEKPAAPAATPKVERPAEVEVPAAAELPSVPVAPVDAPPAEPAS